MFRIRKTRGLYSHKCTTCGKIVEYYNLAVCQKCKETQFITKNSDSQVKISCTYLAENDRWRVWYHVVDTLS